MQPTFNPHTFTFDTKEVRVVTDSNGDPWFVAADICKAIDLGHHKGSYKHHLDKLDDDERTTIPRSVIQGTPTLNMGVVAQAIFEAAGAQLTWAEPEIWIVSESGAYALILRSRDATTPGTVQHRFRKWITSEVLPSIRKTGRYEAEPSQADEPAIFDDEMPVVQRSEQLVSGARIFNAILRVGRQLRLSQSRAAATANRVALRHTGVDVLGEMAVQPEELLVATELTVAGGEADQLAQRVQAWLAASPATDVTNNEIIAGLGLAVDSHERRTAEIRIGILMSRLGWKRREQRNNILRRRIYLRPAPQTPSNQPRRNHG